jgi:chromosome segregation ATPase
MIRKQLPPRALVGLALIAIAMQLVGCGRIDELEAQVSSLESQEIELRARITELESEVEDFEQKLEDVQQALSQVDSDVDDVEREAIVLDSPDKFSLEDAVSSLRSSVDSAISEAN